MSAPEHDGMSETEAAAVDAYARRYFGVKPAGGTLAPARSESGESDEDEQLAAYMRQHFPKGRED